MNKKKGVQGNKKKSFGIKGKKKKDKRKINSEGKRCHRHQYEFQDNQSKSRFPEKSGNGGGIFDDKDA